MGARLGSIGLLSTRPEVVKRGNVSIKVIVLMDLAKTRRIKPAACSFPTQNGLEVV